MRRSGADKFTARPLKGTNVTWAKAGPLSTLSRCKRVLVIVLAGQEWQVQQRRTIQSCWIVSLRVCGHTVHKCRELIHELSVERWQWRPDPRRYQQTGRPNLLGHHRRWNISWLRRFTRRHYLFRIAWSLPFAIQPSTRENTSML